MKMDWSYEELSGLAEDAEEMLEKKLELAIEQYQTSLTLEQMLNIRNEVFYGAYNSFIQIIESGGYSYDYQQIGRFSHLLHESIQSMWLEYVK